MIYVYVMLVSLDLHVVTSNNCKSKSREQLLFVPVLPYFLPILTHSIAMRSNIAPHQFKRCFCPTVQSCVYPQPSHPSQSPTRRRPHGTSFEIQRVFRTHKQPRHHAQRRTLNGQRASRDDGVAQVLRKESRHKHKQGHAHEPHATDRSVQPHERFHVPTHIVVHRFGGQGTEQDTCSTRWCKGAATATAGSANKDDGE